jgi:hypothetical protein
MKGLLLLQPVEVIVALDSVWRVTRQLARLAEGYIVGTVKVEYSRHQRASSGCVCLWRFHPGSGPDRGQRIFYVLRLSPIVTGLRQSHSRHYTNALRHGHRLPVTHFLSRHAFASDHLPYIYLPIFVLSFPFHILIQSSTPSTDSNVLRIVFFITLMGTRYRYHTPAGGPPNDGIPPGTEAPQGAMFCPPYPFGGPPAFGGPLPFGGPQFGPPQCPPPQFGPSPFGPPPPPYGQQMCFPAPGPPPPGPGPMMCFPNQPPPPYAPNPWAQNPWGMPMPISGPSMPTKANERPPPGAHVNGNVAKFGNQQGHIFSKNNTTFHLTLDGAKPWNWGAGGNHRFQVYTAASSMPIDGKSCSSPTLVIHY